MYAFSSKHTHARTIIPAYAANACKQRQNNIHLYRFGIQNDPPEREDNWSKTALSQLMAHAKKLNLLTCSMNRESGVSDHLLGAIRGLIRIPNRYNEAQLKEANMLAYWKSVCSEN